jgi:hypothetical protein
MPNEGEREPGVRPAPVDQLEPREPAREPTPPEHGASHHVSGAETARDESRSRGRLDQLVPDLVRRTLYAGLGALFTTEEGIRKIAGDFQLPKDVANFILQQAASSKDELFRIIAKELRGFLESAQLSQELQKLLTSLSFEIKTEIRFIPNDEAMGGIKPEVKREVAVKHGKPSKGRRTKRDRGG